MSREEGELTAYCGLYCGDCFNHKGEIADLARDLRKILREEKFECVSQGLSKYFKQFKDYEQCHQVLGAMARLRCNRTCRNGGGNPSCKVRLCCQRKMIAGCWECSEFEECNKLDFLKTIHRDANLKNLRKLKKVGASGFLNGIIYK
ncbi:unnamed protein product [marine sediment metagenome]|uniref:GON domain-containing protein n=1 Tax=marine sediment metagenome TaxID=412755 RepID=X1TFR1_9ZZZZ